MIVINIVLPLSLLSLLLLWLLFSYTRKHIIPLYPIY